MGGALKSEWLKLATTKVLWIMLILAVLLMLAGSVLFGLLFQFLGGEVMPDGGANQLFSDPSIPGVLWTGGHSMARIPALIVGVMALGNEYRHKTLPDTYLGTPKRFQVVGAKAIIIFLAGVAMGLLGSIFAYVSSVPFLLMNDAPLLLDQWETWRTLLFSSLMMGLWALMGMGFGVLIRNMIAAVVVGVGFAYIIEPFATAIFLALTQVYPDSTIWSVLQNLMPSAATLVGIGVENPLLGSPMDPFPMVGAFAVMLGWCVVPAAIGSLVTVRRDV